jgi:succinate dehydrogenase / fumarate reductase flavoprotein subunit
LSALERRESRGGHFRDDYPDKHEEFSKINIMVKQVSGAMKVSRVPLPPIRPELQQVIEEQKA